MQFLLISTSEISDNCQQLYYIQKKLKRQVFSPPEACFTLQNLSHLIIPKHVGMEPFQAPLPLQCTSVFFYKFRIKIRKVRPIFYPLFFPFFSACYHHRTFINRVFLFSDPRKFQYPGAEFVSGQQPAHGGNPYKRG